MIALMKDEELLEAEALLQTVYDYFNNVMTEGGLRSRSLDDLLGDCEEMSENCTKIAELFGLTLDDEDEDE